MEARFREIFKKHITQILNNQRTYWKQRYTVRWTKLGDKSTKFLHAAAIERYMINTITSLDSHDGTPVCSHDGKAAMLWEEFKKR
jgi:macrodomain Ter protein organizer (MatP/YcbG family)